MSLAFGLGKAKEFRLTDQLFTIISPVYNVARYLAEYFESLEAQTIGIETLEIILVDDGSTDESLDLCEQFARKYPRSVRVLHQENAGQASARNVGIPYASTDWICFPDPDDVLDERFFDAVREFMGEPQSRKTALFAGHLIVWNETNGSKLDKHPTSFRFRVGNSTTNLDGKPNFIHGNANVSLFRRDIVHGKQMQFDERLRTRFEDASFILEYLLFFEEPVLGLVDAARYYYRLRADGTSTLQSSHSDPRSYIDVPRFGYLKVLGLAMERKARVPRWIQWFIIYDILWLFKTDAASRIPTRSLSPATLSAFHELVEEVLTHIEPETILGFDMMVVPNWLLQSLAFGYTAESYVGPVYIGPTDGDRNLVQLRYRYRGDEPHEEIFVKGRPVQARYKKTQVLKVLGKTLLKERRLWISSLGVIRFELNGRLQQFVTSEPNASHYKFRRVQILSAEANSPKWGVPPRFRQIHGRMRTRIASEMRRTVGAWRRAFKRQNLEDLLLAAVIRLVWVRRAYADSWVLLDREFQANDSAEQLYRWIDEHKPGVKLWFVLRKTSADWKRLRRDGFKLIDYGSYRWKMLMLLAAHVVSSHIDAYITNPISRRRYGRPQWRLSFLQHGIIKGDLSQWLNLKNIDFFATSTEDEYHYIVGESPYKFGPKVVRLTGLPRHDALLQKSAAMAESDVNQLLIAPTWRQYLAGRIVSTSVRERNKQFMESDYAREWQALLLSEDLHEVAKNQGLKIVFMPHPVFQPYLDEFEIPDWIETQLYEGVDVQDVVSRSAMMVTDYSSIAFNMAYLYRPVVYFQFDRDRYFAEHTEGDGYYDYETHGFGPVELDISGVVGAVRAFRNSRDFAERYTDRARRAFPVRDGRNSERVYKAITQLSKPLSFAQATVSAPLDGWPTSSTDGSRTPELSGVRGIGSESPSEQF